MKLIVRLFYFGLSTRLRFWEALDGFRNAHQNQKLFLQSR